MKQQVCNHPELFERADVIAPFSFAHFGRSGPLGREGDLIFVPYSTQNPIGYHIPELLYLDGGLVDVPSSKPSLRSRKLCARNLFNIWSTDRIYQSMYDEVEGAVHTTLAAHITLSTVFRISCICVSASLEQRTSRSSRPSTVPLYAQSTGGITAGKQNYGTVHHSQVSVLI